MAVPSRWQCPSNPSEPPRPGGVCSSSPELVFAPTPPCKPAAAGPSPACMPFLAGRRRRRRRRRLRASVPHSSFMSGKLKKSRKAVLGEKLWQSLEERGSAGTQPGSHPALTRSKTYDPSCKETEEAEVAGGRHGSLSSSLNKRSSSFRKAFGEIAGREALLACFSCAWQREVPYHGRLYVSSGHVCFHASLLLKDIKAVVPVTSICALKKTNTALLVPNALSIRTAEGDKFLFVSLRQREATFQLLKSLCKHLQDNGWRPLASPLNSSATQILKKPLTSSQSDLEESAAEPDSLLEPPGERPPPHPDRPSQPPLGTQTASSQTPGSAGASRRPQGHHPHPRHSMNIPWLGAEEASQAKEEAAATAEDAPAVGRVLQDRPQHLLVPAGDPSPAPRARTAAPLSPFSTIILIYLLLMVALLLTSGYIGLRILQLEQQLADAGAWPDPDLLHQ
ncbi:GRAM domain-containing protein 2A-like isoform X3 [Anser cygnoides]|uniref:GRAM domain-containing protein 2A-like isoform X3 n=1 Tax=Anser cygnoides TaxID=8845 RepID=UPI0034D296B7